MSKESHYLAHWTKLSRDDLIYAFVLSIGIFFGHFYRKINDITFKKYIGLTYGLAIILFTSHWNSLHIFCSFLVCYGVIKVCERKSHIIIFWFMMVYLLFFRIVDVFNLPIPGGHTNMLQMILTLKIIGFAFEKNSVATKIKEKKDLNSAEREIQNCTIMDVVHYCFNYIGLLTGPYYTYKTFHDYFNKPYSRNVNSWKATMHKFKHIPLYAFLFVAVSQIWPLDYMMSDDFYEECSYFYRIFYIWPTFFIFRMRIYSGILLAECVCISAGFGAYPQKLKSKCGHGPNEDETSEILADIDNHEYDFETIENVNVNGVEKCLTFREAMKHWNRCIQYWMAIYVYKQFPSKKYRIVATMAVSAWWHGVHPGYYFCILGPIFYLPIEDLYVKLLRSNNSQIQFVYDILIWILKFFAFSYLGTAFLLKDVKLIWKYYSSVYHTAYIFWMLLYVVCLLLWKKFGHPKHKHGHHHHHHKHEHENKIELEQLEANSKKEN